MSKALDQCARDLAELTKMLEDFIEAQTGLPAYPQPEILKAPARKPAIKRTRAQLIEAATAPVVATEDVDTSWLDLLDPDPVVEPAPLYVDATDLVHINLVPEYVPRRTAPPRDPSTRRTFRQAFLDGYHGN